LPKAGFVAQGTQIGSASPTKTFGDADLANATPYFQAQKYQILFARDYALDADAITSVDAQTDLQVQVWDRHADSYGSDGIDALNWMEGALRNKHYQAKTLGLALIPNHLMFSKLKTMRPSVQLLSDGTHATYPVGYGLATMSVVSRTAASAATEGLDPDTELAATLAEETIRQLAALSVTGASVPDDPNARP
jgi:hypothetical protein